MVISQLQQHLSNHTVLKTGSGLIRIFWQLPKCSHDPFFGVLVCHLQLVEVAPCSFEAWAAITRFSSCHCCWRFSAFVRLYDQNNNSAPAENLVGARLQRFNFTPCCRYVQVYSRTLCHHCRVTLISSAFCSVQVLLQVFLFFSKSFAPFLQDRSS